MRYFITGGSGYIGSRLVELLASDEDAEVAIADVRPPASQRAGVRFFQIDIRSPDMSELLERERPDALIHLAFVLNPLHDEAKMYSIDVNGTENVLSAAAAAGTEQVLVASSTTAYGAWPDNPVPLAEDHPVRGMPNYAYARDKAEIDRLSQLWAAQHPDRTMTIFRPCIVYGPTVSNYLIRNWQNAPFVPLLDGVDSDWQFVHEDDLAEAIAMLARQRSAGIYNVTGDGMVRFSEIAAMLGLKTIRVPLRPYRGLLQLCWKLRVPRAEAPGGQAHFMRYPWIASNEKIKAELDWQPRHTSLQTLEQALQVQGLLKGGPTTAAPTVAEVAS